MQKSETYKKAERHWKAKIVAALLFEVWKLLIITFDIFVQWSDVPSVSHHLSYEANKFKSWISHIHRVKKKKRKKKNQLQDMCPVMFVKLILWLLTEVLVRMRLCTVCHFPGGHRASTAACTLFFPRFQLLKSRVYCWCWLKRQHSAAGVPWVTVLF